MKYSIFVEIQTHHQVNSVSKMFKNVLSSSYADENNLAKGLIDRLLNWKIFKKIETLFFTCVEHRGEMILIRLEIMITFPPHFPLKFYIQMPPP